MNEDTNRRKIILSIIESYNYKVFNSVSKKSFDYNRAFLSGFLFSSFCSGVIDEVEYVEFVDYLNSVHFNATS